MAQDIIKNIPLVLDINASKRLNGTVDIQLYSKDIATGQFEFTFIDEDGNPVVLDETYSAQALVRYEGDSNTYLDDMTIEGNIIRFIFPYDFIIKDGTIKMYIYVTKDNYTSDVAAISFPVFVSEIDKGLDPSVVVHYIGKIEQLIDDLKDEIASYQVDIDEIIAGYEESISKLQALETNYEPQLTSLTAQLAQTETEIDGTNQRIDNLVIPLSPNNSNIEVTDAKVSVTKNKTFDSLTHRFEETETEIKQVEDRELKMTNIISDGNFSGDGSNWNVAGATVSVSSNKLNIIADGSSSVGVAFSNDYNVNAKSGDLIFIKANYELDNSLSNRIRLRSTLHTSSIATIHETNSSLSGVERTIEEIVPADSDATIGRLYFDHRYESASIAQGKTMKVSKVVSLNLTEIFGKGKEPDIKNVKEILKVFDGYLDGTQRLSDKRLSKYSVSELKRLKDNLEENVNLTRNLNEGLYVNAVVPTFNLGQYIHAAGHISTLEDWQYSDPIRLRKFEKISVTSSGSGSNVSIITKTDEAGENRQPLIISVDSSQRVYEYEAEEDMYVAVSGRQSTGIGVILKFDVVKAIGQSGEVVNDADYSVLFSKAVFIGDSLTRGFYAEYPEGTRNRSFNYPSAIAQKTNWQVENMGSSGATTTTWLERFPNIDLSGYDIAFICLGRNGRLNDETQIADYNQIITDLKTQSPNAVIFILSLPPSNDGAEDIVNPIIKSIALDNGLPYLDIATTGVMNQANGHIYRPSDGTHFNKIGYATLALTILEQMNAYIAKNSYEFASLYVEQ